MSKNQVMLSDAASEIAEYLFQQVKAATEKALADLPGTDGDRVPMVFRGEYRSGERYQAGDVVSIMSLGLFQALEETISDPRSNSGAWTNIYVTTGGAPGGGTPLVPVMQIDNIAPLTNGQTSFFLSATPLYPSTVIVNVNGVDYYSYGDFTLAGTTVVWSNPFLIQSSDRVVIRYF